MNNRRGQKPKKYYPDADHFKAACELQKECQYEAAIEEYLNCDLNGFMVNYQIARCYKDLAKYDQTLKYLEEAKKYTHSNNDLAYLCEAFGHVYNNLYKITHENKYLTKLKNAIDQHPNRNNPQCLFLLMSYYQLTANTPQLIKIINYLKENHADNSNVMRMIKAQEVSIKRQLNTLSKEEAKKLVEESLTLPGGNVSILLEVALRYRELIDLKVTPIIHKKNIDGYLREATLYQALNEQKCEEAALLNAIALDKNNVKAATMYAYYLGKHSEYDSAISYLLPFVESKPKPPINQLLTVYHLLANILVEKGDDKTASYYVYQGLALDENDATLNSMLGKLAYKNYGNLNKHFEQARLLNKKRFDRNHPIKEHEAKVNLVNENNSFPKTNSTSAKLSQIMRVMRVGPVSGKALLVQPVVAEPVIEEPIAEHKLTLLENQQPHSTEEIKNDSKVLRALDKIPLVASTKETDSGLAVTKPTKQTGKACSCNYFTLFAATAAAVTTTAIAAIISYRLS